MSLQNKFHARIFRGLSQSEQLAQETFAPQGSFMQRAQTVLARRLAVERAWLADSAKIEDHAPTFWLTMAMSGAALVITGGAFALAGMGMFGLAAAASGALVACGSIYREREVRAEQRALGDTVGAVYKSLSHAAQEHLSGLEKTVTTQPRELADAFRVALQRNCDDIRAAQVQADAARDLATQQQAHSIASAAGLSCVIVPRHR